MADVGSRVVADAVYKALLDELKTVDFDAVMGQGGYNFDDVGLRKLTRAICADCASYLAVPSLAAKLPQTYPPDGLLAKALSDYFADTIKLVRGRLAAAGRTLVA